MLKHKIRALAVTGITTLAATLLTLSATGASAATTKASAPRLVAAPRAAETPSRCVAETFDLYNQYTYEPCVFGEQIPLNDLWYGDSRGPNQLLTVDGHHGNVTWVLRSMG